jgi:hypothetical protein
MAALTVRQELRVESWNLSQKGVEIRPHLE